MGGVRSGSQTLGMATQGKKRSKRAPVRPRPIERFGEGVGRRVSVEGAASCPECGGESKIVFYGHSDSVGARISRQALKKGALCEVCSDRLEDERLAAEEAEVRKGLLARRVEQSGVPRRWRPVTFDRMEWDAGRVPALEAAKRWAEGEGSQGVVLWGLPGRGKTVIAAVAAMERLQRRYVRWVNVADLLMKLRMPMGSQAHAVALRIIDSESTDAALVLDDLDKLNPTEHQLQPLYVAVNGWMERPLPLLVTMNRSPGELAEWAGETFGDTLVSRLMGYSSVVEVQGPDRRLS